MICAVMEGPLHGVLRHVLSNAIYYGSTVFLLAAEVLTNFIQQEPSSLSTLQDSGLTEVLLHALLEYDVRVFHIYIYTHTHIHLLSILQ